MSLFGKSDEENKEENQAGQEDQSSVGENTSAQRDTVDQSSSVEGSDNNAADQENVSGSDESEAGQDGEAVEESSGSEVDADPAPVGYASALEKRVEFEGNVIEAVLHDGKETATLYHCKFSNGTTGHVPKEFLDKELAS